MPIFCTHCGHANQNDAKFCTLCGKPMSQTEPVNMTGANPSAPSAPFVPPAPPVKKKKRTLLIILLPIAAVLLAGILFVCLYILPNILSPNLPELPPVVTDTPEPAVEAQTRTPDYEAYGIRTDLVLGTAVNYVTACYEDPGQMTTGVATVDSYERTAVTEDQIAFGDQNGIDLRGYDRCRVHVTLTFGEEAALVYGASVLPITSDYYDCVQSKDTTVTLTDTMGRTFSQRDLTAADGSVLHAYSWLESGVDTTDSYVQEGLDWIVYVPAGYDGFTVGLMNSTAANDASYLYDIYSPENCHLFRLN